MVASRSINVKWQHKSQDTSEVTKYILQYKEGEGEDGLAGLECDIKYFNFAIAG